MYPRKTELRAVDLSRWDKMQVDIFQIVSDLMQTQFEPTA